METKIKTINDADFLKQFENTTLKPGYFNHIGHLRIAWLYLNTKNLEEAISATCSGIQAYATSHNEPKKFHKTITSALVIIMSQRISTMQEKNWQLFLQQNEDLVDDAISVLNKYYSNDNLFSEEARIDFVKPDIKEF